MDCLVPGKAVPLRDAEGTMRVVFRGWIVAGANGNHARDIRSHRGPFHVVASACQRGIDVLATGPMSPILCDG